MGYLFRLKEKIRRIGGCKGRSPRVYLTGRSQIFPSLPLQLWANRRLCRASNPTNQNGRDLSYFLTFFTYSRFSYRNIHFIKKCLKTKRLLRCLLRNTYSRDTIFTKTFVSFRQVLFARNLAPTLAARCLRHAFPGSILLLAGPPSPRNTVTG